MTGMHPLTCQFEYLRRQVLHDSSYVDGRFSSNSNIVCILASQETGCQGQSHNEAISAYRYAWCERKGLTDGYDQQGTIDISPV